MEFEESLFEKNKVIPQVVQFLLHDILDYILDLFRIGSQWKMLPKEHGSGSTLAGCLRNMLNWRPSKRHVTLLESCDNKKGRLNRYGYHKLMAPY
jgi:hypothetical protein